MKHPILWIPFLFLFLSKCSNGKPDDQFLVSGYWKDQALNDILPYWTMHSKDTVNGAFITNLDGKWKPTGSSDKYPSMISRHLFSYSAAFLMSGDEKYLKTAAEIKNYLINQAWDRKYGGWYDALNEIGDPLVLTKTTFVQVYAITGLAMYYFVTHDKEVLSYIERSNNLLETKVWDKTTGGYFDVAQQNWAVQNDGKSFSSQITPVSGYLLYLYLATREKKYLEQAERITDKVLERMRNSKSGWVMESFDNQWNYQMERQGTDEVNVGHNIEVAWMLLRLYLLNNREEYLEVAQTLSDSLHNYGFKSTNGVWHSTISNLKPDDHGPITYWWIQAYGNMFDLSMYRVFNQSAYLENFRMGASFWGNFFLAKENGDTYFSVKENGETHEFIKANPFKTSYHNIEHAMLNYLYLSFWVNHDPIKLYFKITSLEECELLFPVPVEETGVKITEVQINGEDYTIPLLDNQAIPLPLLENGNIEVTLTNISKR